MIVEYKELFKSVAERPSMYLIEESLACYVSFISGYVNAHQEKPLAGFKEWLIKKRYIGNNQIWEAAVFKINADTEKKRIILFHKLMVEYFQYDS